MKQKLSLNLGVILTCLSMIVPADACTGITLRSKDGAAIFGRTCEWGTFDLKSRLVVIPRDFEIKSDIGDSKTGVVWKTVYGAVGQPVPPAPAGALPVRAPPLHRPQAAPESIRSQAQSIEVANGAAERQILFHYFSFEPAECLSWLMDRRH